MAEKTKPKTKAWKANESGQPSFASNPTIVQKDLLNQTNIDKNNNKFYKMQLEESNGDYRVHTCYGRVGDGGITEFRYFNKAETDRLNDGARKPSDNKGWAEKMYEDLKSAKMKGKKDPDTGEYLKYLPVELESEDAPKKEIKKEVKASSNGKIHPLVEDFIKAIFDCTTEQLKSEIKTPLGKLSQEQIDKGIKVLDEIRTIVQPVKGVQNTVTLKDPSHPIVKLSSQYYSLIPHHFGSRIDWNYVALNSVEKLDKEKELIQLMQDVVDVQHTLDESTYNKFKALNMELEPLEDQAQIQRLTKYIEESKSQHHYGAFKKLKKFWTIKLGADFGRFNPNKFEESELFHGTRTSNLVGIAKHGLLIAPASAPVSGYMYGKGIYFADQSTKSINYSNYTQSGKRVFLLICDVATGKKYPTKTTHHYLEAPKGYDSVFAGRGKMDGSYSGGLLHNEYIVYNINQSRLRYVVEYER